MLIINAFAVVGGGVVAVVAVFDVVVFTVLPSMTKQHLTARMSMRSRACVSMNMYASGCTCASAHRCVCARACACAFQRLQA